MIVSASRRTDIPAFYSNWFFRRLEEGFACTRIPFHPRQVSRISLTPETVDGFVFWTKNPTPMLEKLHFLQEYPYYFQFTLNAYGQDLEPGLPSKNDVLIPVFQELSRRIGPERIIWRYDPILLSPKYTANYHIHYFEAMAKRLSGYTNKCVISFLDMYRHLPKNAPFLPPTNREMLQIAEAFSAIAAKYRLTLETCAEAIDLSGFGIRHGHCIDGALFSRLTGQTFSAAKDKNQRPECGCAASIDIGMYNSCPHGCRYCYANHTPGTVAANLAAHDPSSPLLFGTISPEDILRDRDMTSCMERQTRLF